MVGSACTGLFERVSRFEQLKGLLHSEATCLIHVSIVCLGEPTLSPDLEGGEIHAGQDLPRGFEKGPPTRWRFQSVAGSTPVAISDPDAGDIDEYVV